MQKTTNRIARRITFAFLFFGTVLTLTLGLSLFAVFKAIETSMLDDILRDELKHFRLQVENVQTLGTFRSRTTSIYVAPLDEIYKMPEHVHGLSPGIHDLTYRNRDYRVLVEHAGDMRYVVKFDDTNIHEREQDFIYLIWLCSIVILMIALVIGWGVSYHIVRPIKQLANQITTSKNKPDKPLDLTGFNDDEIGALACELQHYHEQLQYLLNREKEFASNVSHELRTPVTSISLAAEVLATTKDLSTIERKRIQRIQRAVAEMSELIETFLVLAQINNDSTNYCDCCAVCEMGPIVRKVVEQQKVWLGNKLVDVIIEENEQLKVSAPPGILSVLVANLVRNAFRYTEQGTTSVLLTSNQLTIVDTGIGIDATTQARILKHNVKRNSDDPNSFGLGLAIVQRICERYGWTVSFESTKGQGASFTVLFVSDCIYNARADR